MPNHREHLKCAKRLLGYCTPTIHKILDADSVRFGSYHRPTTHIAYILELIEKVFGKEGKREAMLHILQDYGWIEKKDYNF